MGGRVPVRSPRPHTNCPRTCSHPCCAARAGRSLFLDQQALDRASSGPTASLVAALTRLCRLGARLNPNLRQPAATNSRPRAACAYPPRPPARTHACTHARTTHCTVCAPSRNAPTLALHQPHTPPVPPPHRHRHLHHLHPHLHHHPPPPPPSPPPFTPTHPSTPTPTLTHTLTPTHTSTLTPILTAHRSPLTFHPGQARSLAAQPRSPTPQRGLGRRGLQR